MGCSLCKLQTVDSDLERVEFDAVIKPTDKAKQYDYEGPPTPYDEDERYQAVCELDILTMADNPEERFDSITKLCCMLFKVPTCMISLFGSDETFFKSKQNFPFTRAPRTMTLCSWTLHTSHARVMVVEDTLKDARFRHHPLVTGDARLRFFAACPLIVSSGKRIGALSLMSTSPRVFDAESCNMLINMAQMAVWEIERCHVLKNEESWRQRATDQEKQIQHALKSLTGSVMLVDVGAEGWPIVFANESMTELLGLTCDELRAVPGFWSIYEAMDSSTKDMQAKYASIIQSQAPFEMLGSFQYGQDAGRVHCSLWRCATKSQVSVLMPSIGIPVTQPSNASSDLSPTHYFVSIATTPTSPHLSHSTNLSSCWSNSEAPAPSSATPSDAGSRTHPFDGVKLGPLLGKGAFGRVYRGTWGAVPVAVKVLQHTETEAQVQCIEAVVGAEIAHPNVVHTYMHATRLAPQLPMHATMYHDDDDEAAGPGKRTLETWMMMELCSKGSLSDAVERGWLRVPGSMDKVDVRAVFNTAKEVASAMAYLHSKNVLHGDLTGFNVMLTSASTSDSDTRGFTAKVADFGFSRLLQSDQVITKTCGSVTHMPPETLRDGVLSKACDVYAFGAICWEMWMGRRPFSGMKVAQIIAHVVGGKGLAPLPDECPEQLRALIACCCDNDPSARPTFSGIIDELEKLDELLQ